MTFPCGRSTTELLILFALNLMHEINGYLLLLLENLLLPFTAIIRDNLQLKMEDVGGAKFYFPHALADGN